MLTSAMASPAAAQTATPAANKSFIDILKKDVAVPSAAALRTYSSPPFAETPDWIAAYGLLYGREEEASNCTWLFAYSYYHWEIANGFNLNLPSGADAPVLGDESQAFTYQPSDGVSGYTLTILTIRKGFTLQALVAKTAIDPVVDTLVDIAKSTLPRWPNRDAITMKDDIRVGGMWNTMPRPSDMPTGMERVKDQWLVQ